MSFIIETDHLSQKFGRSAAVQDVSLQIETGSVYAFLGPNGAGKTTTIKMLLNILQPTGGSARVLGVDSRQLGPRELAQIGYVSENQELPEWMTVRQMLDYCRPMYPTWDETFCRKLLHDFQLPEDKRIRSLSRGMKVKAALVSSLAYRPRLLIFDEPFSGLDPLVRDEFIRGILELSEEGGWSIFLSSHDIDEVERLADWVGVIDAGRLQLSEPVESLQARFRKIEFTLGSGGTPPASGWPATWLLPEMAGAGGQFIASRYRAGETEAELRTSFPDLLQMQVHPLTLREIFLTLARTFRFRTEK